MILLLVFYIFFIITIFIKGMNTTEQRSVIFTAIFKYSATCIRNRWPICVEFQDMEPYYSTLFRLWDWGYTQILPAEKYKAIEPYIKA